MGVTQQDRILFAVFAVFGLFFLATLHLRPYPVHYLVKAVPIFSLALLARRIPGRKGRLMVLGFLFSGSGDIFLDAGFHAGFLIGLVSFLVAHLFYIAAFYRGRLFAGWRALAALGFLLYGIGIAAVLVPRMGVMGGAIVPYILVITLMGIAACSGAKNHWLIVAGAALFVFSDSVIALNMFLTPIAYKSYWIMTTYYSGQLLLALGALRSFTRVENGH